MPQLPRNGRLVYCVDGTDVGLWLESKNGMKTTPVARAGIDTSCTMAEGEAQKGQRAGEGDVRRLAHSRGPPHGACQWRAK